MEYSRTQLKDLSLDELATVLEKEFPAAAPTHKRGGLNLSGRKCSGSGKLLKGGSITIGEVPLGFCQNFKSCGEVFERAKSI